MSGIIYFDKDGLEISWKHTGEPGQYGLRVKVVDEFTGEESITYIEDIEILRELIEALKKAEQA